MNKYINTFKNTLLKKLIPEGKILVDNDEYVSLNIKAVKRAPKNVEALTPEKLTMKQLGSYIPSFEVLATKPDGFKNSVALMCHTLSNSPEWKYLIEHLKQDQVNNFLFDEERKSEEHMRGSINGIYVVEEQVNLLGSSYNPPKPKEEPETSP